jgi:hypothetical protein
MEKIDILYCVYDLSNIRLDIFIKSINSIDRRYFNVCVYDSGNAKIKDYGFDKYYYKKLNINFKKPVTVNLGFKKIVKSNTFIVSDADIIFPADMVKFHKYKRPNEYLIAKPLMKNVYYDNLIQNKILPDIKTISFYLGGIFITNKKTFSALNGFEERYTGWGYEDRDLALSYFNLTKKTYIVIYDQLVVHLDYCKDIDKNIKRTKEDIMIYTQKFSKKLQSEYINNIILKKKKYLN